MVYESEEERKAIITRLEASYRAIADPENPLDPMSVNAIDSLWSGLKAIQSTAAETSLFNRFQRQCIMITNYGAWFWLDGRVIDKCKEILSGSEGERWLSQLVNDVKRIRSLRLEKKEFKPANYGLSIEGRGFQYYMPSSRIPWDINEEENNNKIISTTVRIIQHWLSFPTGKEATEGRRKAWFVHVVKRWLGDDVLLLNQTWAAYVQTKRNMFTAIDSNNPSLFECAAPFEQAAKTHPLCDEQSEEHKLMKRTSQLLASMRRGEQTTLQIAPQGNAILPANDILDGIQYVMDEKAAKFVTYVKEMLALDCTGIHMMDSPTPLQLAVANSPDKLMPFRESTPGGKRAFGVEGPFSSKSIATKEGLFSALIWRGITFGTRFSVEQPMIFRSIEEWHTKLLDLEDRSLPSHYFCDQKAYGLTNPNRGIQHADSYWNAAGVLFASTLSQEGPAPFLPAFKRFMSDKIKPKVLPQFGPQGCYMLAADYARAGLLSMPSFDELGEIIRYVNGGAAAGLEILGLIQPRARHMRRNAVPDARECREGVRKVEALLLEGMTAEELTQRTFDPVTIETLLFTYSKQEIQSLL